MAIDQTPSPSTTEPKPTPAIENEFPTYRAISSLAVSSIVFGLFSVFSFANLWFLLLVAAAVTCGTLAIRKIRRFPEILTGSSLAGFGIGVSLLFGISAVTHEVVQEVVTSLDARNFVNHFIDIIKDQPVSICLWYEQNVDYRRQNDPDKVVDDVKKSKNPLTPDPYGAKAAPYLQLKERLKSQGQVLRYSKIESKLIVGLTVYANVLVEIDGPVTKEYPEKQYGLIQISKTPGVGKFDWVVQSMKYPYTPSTVGIELPHEDDGHGHNDSH